MVYMYLCVIFIHGGRGVRMVYTCYMLYSFMEKGECECIHGVLMWYLYEWLHASESDVASMPSSLEILLSCIG